MARPVTKPSPVKSATTKAAPAKSPSSPKKSSKKARLISSKLAYKGRVFNVYADMVEEATGFIHQRDVIRHSGSVVILAIDESQSAADPVVILERQYRHAAGQFLIELPAGRIEPKEAPLAAAKREMIEETGYRAKKWTLLTKILRQPGFPRRVHAHLSRPPDPRRHLPARGRRAD